MSNWWESKDAGGSSWDSKASKGDSKWEEAKETNWWEKDKAAAAAPAEPSDPWAAKAKDLPDARSWKAEEAKTDDWSKKDDWPKKDEWSKPADSGGGWGNSNGGGGWGNSDDKSAMPTPTGRDFWEFQKWNKESGKLPRKEDWELDQDDHNLYQDMLGSKAGINFDRYDSIPVDVSGAKSDLIPSVSTFEEMFLTFQAQIPEDLVQNVRRCQYAKPTPVQKWAIPVGLVGRDVMCCAQTGSGKTAAFLFPVIGSMMKNHQSSCGKMEEPFEGPCCPDTLVMTPTRELCIQIYEEALKFTHRTPYRVCRVYGGEKPKVQMEQIALGCDVMVATPGRLSDFIGRGIVEVKKTYVLVLDEADRMLDMGFEPQIREICEQHEMPSKDGRQTMMFSATFPESCQKMAQDFLYDYIWIGVGVVGGAVDTVEQNIVQMSAKDKYDKLFEVLDNFFTTREEKDTLKERCLVFVNAKDTAKWLDEQLYEKKIDTGALHGNLTQEERETNLGRFRRGDIDVLIATDVAARGLDIEKVGLVVNYDFPDTIDSYVHRIGRTGRIGNKGKAITFIASEDGELTTEKEDTLKQLLGIMKDAGSTIPQWLEPMVEKSIEAKAGSYSKWGGKDYRTPTGNDWASGSGNAAGSWDTWNKGGDDDKTSSWDKGGDDKTSSWDKGGDDKTSSWDKGGDAGGDKTTW